MAQKRQRRLCSVDKANVLEVITSKHCLYVNAPNRKRLSMAECVTFEFHKSSAVRKITILFQECVCLQDTLNACYLAAGVTTMARAGHGNRC
jgi:hypothetical protein